MKKISVTTGLCFCLFFCQSGNAQKTMTSKELIDNMVNSVAQLKSLTYKLKKTERVDGVLKTGEQDVKLNISPRKSYAKIRKPNDGVEVLYAEGQNDNKVLVRPNAFPYVNLNLSPMSSIMRKGNHHTLHELGFSYIADVIGSIADKAKAADKFEEYFTYGGEVVFDNKPCYKVHIHYVPFAYISYKVKEGETVTSIATKYKLSDYMILTLNPTISDYDDVKAGQVITIPNNYAKKTILYLDKETFMPIVQSIYDEKGLFEQYEFYNVKVNPVIKDEEFTKTYKDYKF